MNKQTEDALKMAIEFIEMHLTTNDRTFIERTATLQACKEALELSEKQHTISDKEQPAQELLNDDVMDVIKAVAHIGIDWGYGIYELEKDKIDKARAIYENQSYTHPCVLTHSAPSFIRLTDEEINTISDNSDLYNSDGLDEYKFARAIEQALREKNHG